MKGNIIEIKDLTTPKIFENFNISFAENKFITISGPNNCGKTTLIRTLDRKIWTENSITILSKKIEDYKLTEYSSIVQAVIPKEIFFQEETVEEFLKRHLESFYLKKEEKNRQYTTLIKRFKLEKFEKIKITELEDDILLKVQLANSLCERPRILLLDNILTEIPKLEKEQIIKELKIFQMENNMTIIMTTMNLEETLESDYLYIIADSKIILEGVPQQVLEHDNVLNRLGLELPFMMDLSVKLRDYDVLKEIELDMDRMVEKLWR